MSTRSACARKRPSHSVTQPAFHRGGPRRSSTIPTMDTEPTNTNAPAGLLPLLQRWDVRGRPDQPGIPWPRARWVEKFPSHAPMLEALPSILDRAVLRSVCHSATANPDAAITAFIAVLAWGYGRNGYGPWRAEQALAVPQAAEYLQEAVMASERAGALAGYASLAQRAHRLSYFGPAFGTKFLAFCSDERDRPPLILDDLVSKWIARNAGIELPPHRWSIPTYRRYLTVVYRWAAALGYPAEAIELCIFSSESARVGNQWAVEL